MFAISEQTPLFFLVVAESRCHTCGYSDPYDACYDVSLADDVCQTHGYAVENCLRVLEMLGALNPEQAEAKTTVENYLRMPAKVKRPTLEAFVEPKEMTLENLLNAFLDEARLKRVQRIRDKELIIQQETEGLVRALIRDYNVVIDLGNRVILHDCSDWSRVLPGKRFCKNIGKLLLSLDRDKASNILKQIYADKEAWEFKPYTIHDR